MEFLTTTLNNIWTIGLQGIFAGILILFFSEKIKMQNLRNIHSNYAKLLLVDLQEHQFLWNNLSILINQIKPGDFTTLRNDWNNSQHWNEILLGKNFTNENFEFWKNLNSFNNTKNIVEFWNNNHSYYSNMDTKKFEIVHTYIAKILSIKEVFFQVEILNDKKTASENFFGLSLKAALVALIFLSMVRESEKRWYHIYLPIHFKNKHEEDYIKLLGKLKKNECNYIEKKTTPKH